MRVRPRIAFAAPLVVVLGCRRPIAEPLEEPEPRPVDAAVVSSIDAAPDDAALAAMPIDAPVAIDAAVVAVKPPPDPCVDPNARGTCNPPPPSYCRDHPGTRRCPPATTGNPPPPRIARVLKLEIMGDGVIIVVNGGSEAGVTRGSTGYLVTTDGVRVPGGAATMIHVNKRDSAWRVSLNADLVRDNPQIRIELAP